MVHRTSALYYTAKVPPPCSHAGVAGRMVAQNESYMCRVCIGGPAEKKDPPGILRGGGVVFGLSVGCTVHDRDYLTSTVLGLQSRFGDQSLQFKVVCPQDGTAVLKGVRVGKNIYPTL